MRLSAVQIQWSSDPYRQLSGSSSKRLDHVAAQMAWDVLNDPDKREFFPQDN
jgi:hypothetical protein